MGLLKFREHIQDQNLVIYFVAFAFTWPLAISISSMNSLLLLTHFFSYCYNAASAVIQTAEQ